MVDQLTPVVGSVVAVGCRWGPTDRADDGPTMGRRWATGSVLSGMRLLVIAAPLGGARSHDDDMIQTDSLRDEWSVDSWTYKTQDDKSFRD